MTFTDVLATGLAKDDVEARLEADLAKCSGLCWHLIADYCEEDVTNRTIRADVWQCSRGEDELGVSSYGVDKLVEVLA